jgi:hypothetical protein
MPDARMCPQSEQSIPQSSDTSGVSCSIKHRLCEAVLTWADANLQILDGAAFADDNV